jgi:hypothetical protein
VPEHARNGAAEPPRDERQPPDPLAEAEALRDLLAEAQSRLGRLLGALKHQRRQARAVEAAVASLRRLGQPGG